MYVVGSVTDGINKNHELCRQGPHEMHSVSVQSLSLFTFHLTMGLPYVQYLLGC